MIAVGANAPAPAVDATLAVDIIKGLEDAINADDKDTALKLLHELNQGLQVACTKYKIENTNLVSAIHRSVSNARNFKCHCHCTSRPLISYWQFTQVRSGLMQRPGHVGGVAYKPEFLLDCILLCDNLREPSAMRDTISRTLKKYK